MKWFILLIPLVLGNSGFCNPDNITETNRVLSQMYGVERVKCSALSVEECFRAQKRARELIETSPRDYSETVIRTIFLAEHNMNNHIPYDGMIFVDALGEESLITFIDEQIELIESL